MPDLDKIKVIEDAINKILESLTEYMKALLYTMLYRQGMNLNRAESILRKGPE